MKLNYKDRITQKKQFKEIKNILNEIGIYVSDKEYKTIKDDFNIAATEYSKKVIYEINKNIDSHNYDNAKEKLFTLKNIISDERFEKGRKIIEKNRQNYDKKLNRTKNQAANLIYNDFFVGGCVISRNFEYNFRPDFKGTIMNIQSDLIMVRKDGEYDKTYNYFKKELFNIPCDLEKYEALKFLNNLGISFSNPLKGNEGIENSLTRMKRALQKWPH